MRTVDNPTIECSVKSKWFSLKDWTQVLADHKGVNASSLKQLFETFT